GDGRGSRCGRVPPHSVIPAEAGIQSVARQSWTPAFAGVTGGGRGAGPVPPRSVIPAKAGIHNRGEEAGLSVQEGVTELDEEDVVGEDVEGIADLVGEAAVEGRWAPGCERVEDRVGLPPMRPDGVDGGAGAILPAQ